MSLFPGDSNRKGRSRSRSRDGRPKDESSAPETPSSWADIQEPSYVYPEDDDDERYKRRGDPPPPGGALPYPEEYSMLPGDQAVYSYDSQQPVYRTASPTRESSYRTSRDKVDDKLPGAFPEDDHHHRGKDKDDDPRIRFAEPRDDKYGRKGYEDEQEKLKYLPQKYAGKSDRKDDKHGKEEEESKLKYLPQKYIKKYITGDSDDSSDDDDERRTGKDKYEDDLAYGKPSVPVRPKQPNTDLAYGKATGVPKTSAQAAAPSQAPATYGSYVSGDQWEDNKRTSKYDPRDEIPDRRPVDDYGRGSSRVDPYHDDPRGSNPNVLTVDPGARDRDTSRDRRREKSPTRESRESRGTLTVESSSRHRDKSRDRSRDRRRDKSPGARASGDTLTVESGHGHKHHREKSRDRSKRDKSPAPDTLIVESSRHRDRSRDGRRDKSPLPPTSGRGSSLTVNTGRLAGMSIAQAPASPLLESYYGTYQDCSPMPSPLLLASGNPSDDPRAFEALSPLSDGEGDGKKRNRRARFHDPEEITSQIANALKGTRAPDTGPLIHILPSLTHDQVMELRVEYKRMVKTGADRKGVNVAKHIRARLKDEDPNLMKACYSVALGKWESEAYWANFWYQGDKTRRELLIEALMGRTNGEIALIKDAFTDKKYDNSLTKCMKTELREDKFKKAVLMVLEERRMEEFDHHGRRLPLDYELVDRDVDDLRKAVKSEKGGETLMISIIVQRSESHLRAVLQEYDHHYRSNFTRDCLKKSGNLVGELLAHILNGVINRPVRDALLLHHAVSASRKDGLRRELLISRLVRFHWDPHHMQAVKRAFRERYKKDLQEAVKDATSGEWGLFCRELCIARMPDDVKKIERVTDIR
ncbi:Fc.00g042210.m01.CDS01 [Cosmosporella sp. VM-42]